MILKGKPMLFLDGDFQQQTPEPVVYSNRAPDGGWTITKAGPHYCNVYEVTEFDAAGEAWLIENDAARSSSSARAATEGTDAERRGSEQFKRTLKQRERALHERSGRNRE